jgi:curli biogenesis system outer membrane secretion channel CsgG
MFHNARETAMRSLLAASVIALCAITSSASAQTAATAPFSGPKKSIAVTGFDGTISFEGGDAAQGLTTMLTDALIKDGRFVVIERAAIAEISAEHALVPGTAAATTQITSANVLVRGTVTKFAPKVSGGGLSAGFMGSGSLGGALGISGDHSDVELNIRLIDTGTGRILSSINAKASVSSHGVTANVATRSGMSFGGTEFKNSPIGQACEQAVQQAVDRIAAAMDKVSWSAQVISSDSGQIYIDAGEIQNIQTGEVFKVYHKGKVLTDPSTNAVIDVIEDPVGSIKITTVREKTSAAIVSDGAVPARGDIVRVN